MDFSKFSEYGPNWLFMGAVLFILYRMIVWVMAFVKQQDIAHSSERTTWQQSLAQQLFVISSLKASIDAHSQSSVESRKATEEAHKYQREEHIKMMEKAEITCACLKEVEQSLGRINGYKSG